MLFFFLSCACCHSQFDIAGYSIRSLGSSAATGNDDNQSTAEYTPRIGTMLIAIVVNTKASAPNQPSVEGNSLTWTLLFDTNYLSTHRLTVWYAKCGSGATRGAFTASTTGVNQTGWAVGLVEVEGSYITGLNGVNSLIQNVNANVSAGTSITATFGSLHGGTLCIGLLGANLNGTAMTAEAGWTELIDANYNTPATEITVVARVKNTDTTCAVSNGSSFSGCIVGIELAQEGNYP